MTRARAVVFGALAAVIAVQVALVATWAFLVSLGPGRGAPPDAAAVAEPLLLILLAAVVFGVLAYGRESTGAVATVELAAGAAGLSLLALASDFWRGPFLLLFAVPPALFLSGAACALADSLKRAPSQLPAQPVRASSRSIAAPSSSGRKPNGPRAPW